VLGTLGFHAEKFLPAIRSLPDVRKVIVYDAPGETTKKDARAKRTLRQVRRSLAKARVVLIESHLKDPWDVSAMMATFLQDLRREGPGRSVFNLTGGTKTMTVAATLACLVTGTRAVYVPEESERMDLVEVPLPTVLVGSILTKGKEKVLKALSNRDFDSMAQLAGEVCLAPATVSHHISTLRQLRAVEVNRGEDARTGEPRITQTGRVLLILHHYLGADADRGIASQFGNHDACRATLTGWNQDVLRTGMRTDK